MANRELKKKSLKIKQSRMKRRGKFNMKQILKDRADSVMRSEEHTVLRLQHDPQSIDVVTVVGKTIHKDPHWDRKTLRNNARNQFINTGHVNAMSMHGHRMRVGSKIYRNKRGHIFVVDSKFDEFIATGMGSKALSDDELAQLGQPDEEGWRSTNPYPLAEVKRKLKQLQEEKQYEKWLYFIVAKTDQSHLALFFSPKKDAWMYVRINPETGETKRTLIYPNKHYAEIRRLSKTWTWKTLTSPIIKLN